MERQPTSRDGDSETFDDVLRDRARLRIAYITLYKQYLDLDETVKVLLRKQFEP